MGGYTGETFSYSYSDGAISGWSNNETGANSGGEVGTPGWWDYEIATREAAARANTESNPVPTRDTSSPSLSFDQMVDQSYRTRDRYVDVSTLGDTGTRTLVAQRGWSVAYALEQQRKASEASGDLRGARFYENELALANAQWIERSSAEHHVGLALGIPTGPNRFEYAGDKALILEKGMQEVDKGQLGRISEDYTQYLGTLPHPGGLQGAAWDRALGISQPRYDWGAAILGVEAARGKLGPYAVAGRSTSYIPGIEPYQWDLSEQQQIAKGQTLSPLDPFRVYVGEGPGNYWFDTTRAGVRKFQQEQERQISQPSVIGAGLAGGYYEDFFGPGVRLHITKGAAPMFQRMTDPTGALILGTPPEDTRKADFSAMYGPLAGVALGVDTLWSDSNKKAAGFFKGVRAQDTIGQWGLGGEAEYEKWVMRRSSDMGPVEAGLIGATETIRSKPLDTAVYYGVGLTLGAAYEGIGAVGAATIPKVSSMLPRAGPRVVRLGQFAYNTALPAAMAAIYGTSIAARALEPDEMGNVTAGSVGMNVGNMTPEFLGFYGAMATYPEIAGSVKRGAGWAGTKLIEAGKKVDVGIYQFQQRSMGIENIGVGGGNAKGYYDPVTGKIGGGTYNLRQLKGFPEYQPIRGTGDLLKMSSRDVYLNEWGMYGKPYQPQISLKGISATGEFQLGYGNAMGARNTYNTATLKAMHDALGRDWLAEPNRGYSMFVKGQKTTPLSQTGQNIVSWTDIYVPYNTASVWSKKFDPRGFSVAIERPGRAIYRLDKGFGVQYPSTWETRTYGGDFGRLPVFKTTTRSPGRKPSKAVDFIEGMYMDTRPIRQVSRTKVPGGRSFFNMEIPKEDLYIRPKKVSGQQRVTVGSLYPGISAPAPLRARDITAARSERAFWYGINSKQQIRRQNADTGINGRTLLASPAIGDMTLLIESLTTKSSRKQKRNDRTDRGTKQIPGQIPEIIPFRAKESIPRITPRTTITPDLTTSQITTPKIPRLPQIPKIPRIPKPPKIPGIPGIPGLPESGGGTGLRNWMRGFRYRRVTPIGSDILGIGDFGAPRRKRGKRRRK